MARVLLMLMVMVLTSRAEDSSDNALGPPPLQIDPQLRRALLQALTQLEKEAQEESNFTTEQPEEFSTEDYELPTEEPAVEIDSYQKPPDTEKEGGEEEKPPPEQELENLDFQSTESAVQSFSKVRISFDNKSEKGGNSSVQTSTQDKPPSKVITEGVDVRSNEISDKKPEIFKPELVESVSINVKETKDVEEKDFEEKAGKEEATSSTNVNPKIEENKSVNASDKEVAFFEAPLVAAFTLHHDEHGLPKSVVPLFRQEQSSASSQSESFSLSKEQQLEQRTIKLQEQLLQLQQQQIQQQQLINQQQLLKESQERERLRQQRAFQEEQRLKQQQLFREQQERQARQQRFQLQQEQKIRQLQQQQQQQPQFFSQEQQSPRLRSQRQEQGTAIVDFQKSVDVPFRTTPVPIINNLQFPPQPSSSIPTAPNFFRNQQQQTFTTFSSNFNSNNNLNTNFNRNNNNNFNSNNNLNTNFNNNNNNFNSNFNSNKNFNSLNNNNNFQPSRQNFITSQSQQYRTIVQQDPSLSSSLSDNINTFQTPPSVSSSFSSNFNTFQSPPAVNSFFPSNFNTFQTPPSVNSPFSSNFNTFQQPPTVDTQLKSLLFQSGVAGELQNNIRNGASPLEDLNILSKVLLLDPESHRGRSGRTTQEGHHLHNSQIPSRQHSIPRV